MSLRVHFLRHGETIYSRTGGYCGELDPELTAEGELMAAAFAAAHRSTPWDALYVSPMRRTVATARPLCEALGLEMQLRDGLKEIRYGAWEGKTSDDVKAHYADDYVRWLTEPAWNPPTGGETSVAIASRAMPVIAEIESKYAEGNVLVVSHKATIRIMLCSLLGIDLGRYRDRINILAASLSTVKFDVHGPLLESLNDRAHLGQELRTLPGT
ncbi:histidine phosphatase family protein [Gloeobacter morelensis]|uniref:Histidine phosphatase family protein n=1 Tax=Gloeobacter morelensis MG652769 TaxID=2781736 RepID=A0ABY3PG65_9CYAN|nr:histidine phosphatase family protein [Gloeobacter morelensis]UFP92642.1 histidine phosphatase family protein [Gloeobacter morelensis MG652769]